MPLEPQLGTSEGMLRISAILFSGLVGVVHGQSPTVPAAAPEALRLYRLGPGDLIQLQFHYNPELNAEIAVRPDGYLSGSLVGELKAAGLSPGELSEQLTRAYAKHLRNPQLTVVLKSPAGQSVFVGGEVMGARAVELKGSLTFLQAVMSVGGPRTSARLSEALLVRYQGEGKAEVVKVDLAKVMKGSSPDITLQAYDVLMIPKRRVAKVAQFVDEYINAMVPKSLFFPYNLNNTISYNVR